MSRYRPCAPINWDVSLDYYGKYDEPIQNAYANQCNESSIPRPWTLSGSPEHEEAFIESCPDYEQRERPNVGCFSQFQPGVESSPRTMARYRPCPAINWDVSQEDESSIPRPWTPTGPPEYEEPFIESCADYDQEERPNVGCFAQFQPGVESSPITMSNQPNYYPDTPHRRFKIRRIKAKPREVFREPDPCLAPRGKQLTARERQLLDLGFGPRATPSRHPPVCRQDSIDSINSDTSDEDEDESFANRLFSSLRNIIRNTTQAWMGLYKTQDFDTTEYSGFDD